jgi:hypothetical protein
LTAPKRKCVTPQIGSLKSAKSSKRLLESTMSGIRGNFTYPSLIPFGVGHCRPRRTMSTDASSTSEKNLFSGA